MSVFVVVLAVSRMPASIVHVVDMIPMRHRDMATPLPVDMVMLLVHRVAGWLTFVVVILVLSMKVTVVHEVDMIPVWDRDMATSFAVQMIVLGMLVVGCAGHRSHRRIEILLTSSWRTTILVQPCYWTAANCNVTVAQLDSEGE